jgi:Zn-dependent protease
MRPSIRLFRVFGIDIGIHYSWFIIALLIVFSLSGYFHMVNPGWSVGLTWLLALTTALFFFASILIHELAHAAVANARGMPVKSITLFALGGVANVDRESVDAKSEFLVAIAGPVTSFAIGLFFMGVARIVGWRSDTSATPSPVSESLVWLGYINVLLALFNLIPGYPLDGGRILRSIIWSFNRNLARATRITVAVGRVVAFAFIVFGVFSFFYSGAFGGLWLAFIGWFLSDAAAASQANLRVSDALAHVQVGDVMSRNSPTIDGNVNLRTFAEEYLLKSGRPYFVVSQNDREIGFITVSELKRLDRARWPFTTVADAAVGFDALPSVAPATPLTEALDLMVKRNINQLPVFSSDGAFVGVISRSEVVQFVQTHAEMKAA